MSSSSLAFCRYPLRGPNPASSQARNVALRVGSARTSAGRACQSCSTRSHMVGQALAGSTRSRSTHCSRGIIKANRLSGGMDSTGHRITSTRHRSVSPRLQVLSGRHRRPWTAGQGVAPVYHTAFQIGGRSPWTVRTSRPAASSHTRKLYCAKRRHIRISMEDWNSRCRKRTGPICGSCTRESLSANRLASRSASTASPVICCTHSAPQDRTTSRGARGRPTQARKSRITGKGWNSFLARSSCGW